MNFIRFPQANTIMHGPKDMPEGKCADVHAYSDGKICVVLAEPTPEERAAIAAGGPIWISFHMSGVMPPVSINVETPFIEPPDQDRLEEIAGGAPACDNCVHFTHEANGMGHCERWAGSTPFHYQCREHFPK